MRHGIQMDTTTVSRAKRVRHAIVVGIKRFIMFLFSQVGLTSAVVAYSILGGMIFQGMEAPYEIDQREKVVRLREEYTKELVRISEDLENTTESYDKWIRKAGELVEEFQNKVYALTTDYGWDGEDPDEELQWSFPGALLFSVTVITTIGYGHIAPKTNWGRIVTVMYAVLGIPLTFLCLRNIGSLLSSCVKLVYQHACIGLMRRWLLLKRRMRRSRRIAKIREAAVRARKWSRQRTTSGVVENGGEYRKYDSVDSSTLFLSDHSAPGNGPLESREIMSRVNEEDIDHLSEEPKPVNTETSDIRVPVSLTLFLMTGYIIGGAIMFALWEDDWDYLIASYFCFITLSTIGFGDYVPGTTSDSWASQEKRVICCMYLLFGMAMQAMCFHLMQEEVRHKFRNLARKVGLLEKEQKTQEEED